MKYVKSVKSIAAGGLIAGALGAAALGVGSGVANADPWGHGPGWGHGHGWGPGWVAPPPPPPPPYYGAGYGGYGYAPPPCVTGPLGFVQLCA